MIKKIVNINGSVKTVNNNIGDNNKIINNTNNIKIVSFGKEDMSKITKDMYKIIFDKGFQSVPKLIEFPEMVPTM